MATTKKKYLDKFDDEESLVAGYAELEKKLGEQGKEVGELKKLAEQFPQLQQQLQQYAEAYQRAQPVYDWYAKNEAEVKRRWQIAERFNQGGNANGQAAEIAQSQPGFAWMTPQEQQQLTASIHQQLMEKTFNPWAQGLQAQIEQYAKQQVQAVNNQMTANTNVLWNTLKHLVPPEKMEFARKLHEVSMKYADPKQLDPMKAAEEFLALSTENESLKAKATEFETKQQEWEKARVPSLGTGAPPSLFKQDDTTPQTREDRMKFVMEDVKAQHGNEGLAEMFPSLSR